MTAAVLSPPGPKGHWLTGNLRDFRRDMLGFYTRLAREYGDVARFRLGPKRLVLVSHPDFIEQVLVTENRNFIKHYALRLLTPTLGNGLLMSEGDFWLRQRRLIQPAFSKQRIESYAGLMVEHSERLLAEYRDGESRDLHADMMRLTLGIVAQALLDVNAADRYREVSDAIDEIMHDFNVRFQTAFPIPFWVPTPANQRVKQAVRRLDAIIHEIIQSRRTEGIDRGDLLSVLVHARDEQDQTGMTDRQLRDEVMTLFLAGHETTANVLSWTWYLLATHPRIEAQLHAELQTVLSGRLPTAADVPRLKFTEQIILESMRLYPPAYAFGREAVRDCEIGGCRIPRGTTVLLAQWVTHRDPRFFDRPDEFDPHRWDGEFAKQIPKYAYFPFGGGPRGCIGNTFAMLEATLIVATMASRFRFSLVPDQPVVPWASVTLRPEHGLPATVHRR